MKRGGNNRQEEGQQREEGKRLERERKDYYVNVTSQQLRNLMLSFLDHTTRPYDLYTYDHKLD